jgi:hypothetical protein
MLWAAPRSFFSWWSVGYTVRTEDNTQIAEVELSKFRESADVTISGQVYAFRREGVLHAEYALLHGDHVLARAKKVSVFSRAFNIDLAGRPLELKALSFWSRRFGLFENESQVGSIRPASWFGRRVVLDLPEDVPLPAQVFLLWLVLIVWPADAS